MSQPADPTRLLAAVADALNQCERSGIMVRLAHGTVVTGHGYVLAVGDPRLGARWQARTRLRPEELPAELQGVRHRLEDVTAGGSAGSEEVARGDHVAG